MSTSNVEAANAASPGLGVYVSYNVREYESVAPIVERLSKDGIPLWLDKRELRPGVNWHTVIEEVKRLSPVWVVFLGPHGPGRTHGQEIEEAMNRATSSPPDLVAIPVLLPAAEPPFPRLFEVLFRIEFTSPEDPKAYQQLLHSLSEHISNFRPPAAKQESKPVSEAAADPKLLELVSVPQQLATFCARFVLYDPAAARLVEAPDSAVLAEALRRCNIRTDRDLVHLAEKLQAEPPTAKLGPNALWVAWFTTAKAEKLEQIKQDLLALPRAGVSPAANESSTKMLNEVSPRPSSRSGSNQEDRFQANRPGFSENPPPASSGAIPS